MTTTELARKKKDQPPADPAHFDEAVEWFRERVSLTKDEWLELDEAMQAKAFTIAGVSQLRMIEDVWNDLLTAMEKGVSLELFKKQVSEKLASAWGEDRPWHVENVFRTNLQRAYSHGRHQQMEDPAVLADRPYRRFSAVLDARTTKLICLPLHGTVLPAEHPWWKTHIPPLHFQCRSQVQSLSRERAAELGITSRAPSTEPMEGFGLLDDWEPNLSDSPDELVKVYRRGQ